MRSPRCASRIRSSSSVRCRARASSWACGQLAAAASFLGLRAAPRLRHRWGRFYRPAASVRPPAAAASSSADMRTGRDEARDHASTAVHDRRLPKAPERVRRRLRPKASAFIVSDSGVRKSILTLNRPPRSGKGKRKSPRNGERATGNLVN